MKGLVGASDCSPWEPRLYTPPAPRYSSLAATLLAVGIGVPNFVGATAPSNSMRRFFCARVLSYGGLRGGFFGSAGAYEPVRQPRSVRLHSDWRQIETASYFTRRSLS